MDCKKDCEPEKVCNKLSGRCVKKTGRIGKTKSTVSKSKSKRKSRLSKSKSKSRLAKSKSKSRVSRSKSKSRVSRSKSKSNPKKTDDGQVYHPFYKRQIEYESPENCSSKRQSIKALTGNPRMVLENICDLVPLQNITSILGPYMYREYNYKGINISIFGEQHTITSKKAIISCLKDRPNTVSITNFIKTLLTLNPKKTYDVYLEMDYISRENKDRIEINDINFSISMFQREFRECLSLAKSGCQYDNLRMHYTDPRFNFIPSLRELVSMAYGDKSKLTEAFALKILDELNEVLASTCCIKKELEKSYLKT